MSYSGQSNPPWQRNTLGNAGQTTAGLQSQMGLQNQTLQFQNQSIFNQNMTMGHQSSQNPNVSFSQFSGNTNQIPQAPPAPPFSGVSYPQQNSRNLNPIAFSMNSSNPSAGGCHTRNQGSNYSSIGTVTKFHNDCGFVDDEVFFNKNVCKGGIPKLGDRVLVEATFSTNLPFKWNATRIQIIPSGGGGGGGGGGGTGIVRNQAPLPLMGTNLNLNIKGGSVSGSGYNAVPPPNEYNRNLGQGHQGQRKISPPLSRRSPDRHGSRTDSRHRDDDEVDRKRRRDEREREREREREGERERERERMREKRDHSSERRERERSPVRRTSPKRRRTRAIPRYMVQIPKISLTIPEADVLELRHRYTNLYVPSDFFLTQIKWSEAFTPDKPFSIHRPCSFHIMHKSVDPPKEMNAPADPPDANYLYSAKVMLMSVPPITEFYEKCLSDDKDRDDNRDYIHPSRLINFLIGVRGKNEIMAIGGPWSPLLDGEDPKNDPSVLIKTAIRTCKALTRIDLSACTQWYRFVELYYRRSESVHKGQLIPARIETVVIFLPDINSCVPTRIEWDNFHRIYKSGLERALNPENSLEDNNSPIISGQETIQTATSDNQESQHVHDKDKKEPTHFSKLDPKSMKVQELRDELEVRNLSSKGLKPQLIARLIKALNTEKAEKGDKEENIKEEEEENEETRNSVDNDQTGEDNIENMDMNDIVILDEYDSTKNRDIHSKEGPKILDEKERRQLERRYQLPENPHIIIHPSRTAKSGKFDCTLMSLSVLLDYRPEDTKERSFEVSLFAELFNEMIMRDFGFNIYKEIALSPEKPKDKDETAKKDEEKITSIVGSENKLKDNDEKKENNHSEKPREQKGSSEHEKNEKKIVKDREKDKNSKREDDTEDDDFSVKSGERKRRRKMIIVKHELLLSFMYFDTTHCGYIFEKDLEDLFYILGLCLSRNQVRKLLSKVVLRDALYYRKLTDKPKDDENDTIQSAVKVESTAIDISELAKGNKVLIPKFDTISQEEINQSKKRKLDNKSAEITGGQGMVFYNGGLADVGKLIEQMKRSDKAREETEQILTDLRKQNTDLQASNNKSNNKIKDLQSEVKNLNRKLIHAEQNASSLQRTNNEYCSVISSIYDKIPSSFKTSKRSSKRTNVPYFSDPVRERERLERVERDKERYRDKDDEKDDKDRDNDKDKDEKTKERGKDKNEKEHDQQHDEKSNLPSFYDSVKERVERDKERHRDKDDEKDDKDRENEKNKVKDEKTKEPEKDNNEKDHDQQHDEESNYKFDEECDQENVLKEDLKNEIKEE